MKFTHQHDQMDCGPACLSMVASYYGKNYSLQYLREHSFLTKEGVSLLGLTEAAHQIGFETLAVKLTVEQLIAEKARLPVILHWNQNHFTVLHKITFRVLPNSYHFHICDPAHGKLVLNSENFKKSWIADDQKGIVVLLSPSEKFHEYEDTEKKTITIKYVMGFLNPFKKQLVGVFFLMLLGSLLTLALPFLTQSLIDRGINGQNLGIITIILLSQLSIFCGVLIFQVLRNWIMLFVGTKVSISIISNFLKKLLELPVRYFDTKLMGDFNQRIQDNERIENFLTSQSLLTLFSMLTFFVFFGVLWYYDIKILLVYLVLTVLSVGWSLYWLTKRYVLDYFKFQHRSENQESIFEIINGVTEIKLNQFEDFKRNKWEQIQQKLFKINIRILKIDQVQLAGFEFINQLKNILVTYLSATFVVKGTMTLGELLSVSYIVGQMNAPVSQLLQFFISLQEARLSLERLTEVQEHEPEEHGNNSQLISTAATTAIHVKNVSFQYEGPKSPYILKNINLNIPKGKITAIVGASGSGKSTLLKLLLKFYDPVNGEIFYNGTNILNLSARELRKQCGVVMQDGFIFSDTIDRNIATGDKIIDPERLSDAVRISNIGSFISKLPLQYHTKIGAAGNGISGGQKQRILIARAVYKNPQYIFFDEATSALDAENEKIIHDNLQEFFSGKTVVIIAHRLSTVKNADQIIMLKEGQIVERGNHKELVNNKSDYFDLVRNQLELGN